MIPAVSARAFGGRSWLGVQPMQAFSVDQKNPPQSPMLAHEVFDRRNLFLYVWLPYPSLPSLSAGPFARFLRESTRQADR